MRGDRQYGQRKLIVGQDSSKYGVLRAVRQGWVVNPSNHDAALDVPRRVIDAARRVWSGSVILEAPGRAAAEACAPPHSGWATGLRVREGQ